MFVCVFESLCDSGMFVCVFETLMSLCLLGVCVFVSLCVCVFLFLYLCLCLCVFVCSCVCVFVSLVFAFFFWYVVGLDSCAVLFSKRVSISANVCAFLCFVLYCVFAWVV